MDCDVFDEDAPELSVIEKDWCRLNNVHQKVNILLKFNVILILKFNVMLHTRCQHSTPTRQNQSLSNRHLSNFMLLNLNN